MNENWDNFLAKNPRANNIINRIILNKIPIPKVTAKPLTAPVP